MLLGKLAFEYGADQGGRVDEVLEGVLVLASEVVSAQKCGQNPIQMTASLSICVLRQYGLDLCLRTFDEEELVVVLSLGI